MRKSILTTVFVFAVAPVCLRAQLSMPPVSTGGSTQSIDEVRKGYRVHVGPLYINPSILLKELGIDSNVFNAAGEQKSDFTFTITPQAAMAIPMARRGLLLATLGMDMVYYAQYDTERSVDPQVVVRAEAYANRVTLFVEDSYLNSRQRPNHEIDVRSRHLQNDVSGGASIRLTPKFSVEAARRHGETRFAGDAFFGRQLQEALNRDSDGYSLTARYKHSALTTFGVRYENQQDRFQFSPVRDTDSFRVMPGIEFKPRALISGSAWVGYRRFGPESTLLPEYSGVVLQLALAYTLLGSTTFGVTYNRDVSFSVEGANPYFVENSPGIFIRRAVGGRFDVIGNAARYRYDYKALATQSSPLGPSADRVDTTHNYGVSLGYRLKKQTRIGVGVSYWTRESTLVASRAYNGLRVGTTVTYGF